MFWFRCGESTDVVTQVQCSIPDITPPKKRSRTKTHHLQAPRTWGLKNKSTHLRPTDSIHIIIGYCRCARHDLHAVRQQHHFFEVQLKQPSKMSNPSSSSSSSSDSSDSSFSEPVDAKRSPLSSEKAGKKGKRKVSFSDESINRSKTDHTQNKDSTSPSSRLKYYRLS